MVVDVVREMKGLLISVQSFFVLLERHCIFCGAFVHHCMAALAIAEAITPSIISGATSFVAPVAKWWRVFFPHFWGKYRTVDLGSL